MSAAESRYSIGSPTATAAEVPAVQVDGLTVRAGDGSGPLLVDGVSFEVARGERVAIVGESGSGKSLTLRALLGLLPAGVRAEGTTRVSGLTTSGCSARDLRALRRTRARLVMQDPFTALNPVQTVGKTIGESFDAGVDRRALDERISRALREVQLSPEVAQRYPFELSGGMRQRAGLAAALAGDPEVLLCDEPTTALDATIQAEILGLLDGICRSRGMSLLLVTHDLSVALRVCDRVMVMYAGSLVEDASASAIGQTPAHPYSVALMSAAPSTDRYVARLPQVPGMVPRPDSVRHQCAFAARCRWAEEACTSSRPALRAVSTGHTVACARVTEISTEVAAAVAAQEEHGVRPVVEWRSTLISMVGVSKSYAAVRRGRRPNAHDEDASSDRMALDEVSLKIGEGESVGLVGESGSGKTTLARIMAGLVTADSGAMQIDGVDFPIWRELRGRQRRALSQQVQTVFQDPYASLNPAFSIGKSIDEALRLSRGTPHSSRDLMELVGLPAEYLGRRPSQLSGGERQRVSIARALAVSPRLLVCDEPVAALDVIVQAQILQVIRGVQQELGTALLFISHDLAVVNQMCNRVYVMLRGRVVDHDTTDSLLAHPRHEYTRRLIAAHL